MNAPSKVTPITGATKVTAANRRRRKSPTAQSPALVTVITSEQPKTLTKRFRLERGELVKEGGGVLIRGQASVREIADLAAFATLLTSLGPSQALTYGVPEAREIAIITKDAWEDRDRPDDAVPRTNETFSWPKGPGIMMLDYDPEPGAESLTQIGLVEAIRAAAPDLRDAQMLWWPSASSNIRNGETAEQLTGLRGQRLYLMVEDARDIPRAGRALADHLWLEGHGYIKISASGSLLERTLVDTSVWQSSRLDFAAGAQCEGPLVQGRGEPTLIAGKTVIVDGRSAIPDLRGAKADVVARLKETAKADKAAEARKAREAWLDRRAREIAGPEADEDDIATARAVAERALDTTCLPAEFIIHVMDGRGTVPVSVREILANRARYHRKHTLDPLEPEYGGSRPVGMLFLDRKTPVLHSFARGERTFTLGGELEEIVIYKGKLARAVDETLEVMRQQPDLYDFGDRIVLQEHGKIHPLDEHALNQLLSSRVQFRSYARKKPIDIEPPPNLAKRILAQKARRRLNPLVAVITAPTLRPDGSVLEQVGYDPETAIFYYFPDGVAAPKIPEAPNLDQVRQALEVLWEPFVDFPFVDSVDRGVFLAALLTASVRSMLPTAPGFGFDAPIQGSGKTLLANCVAVLAGCNRPLVYPHVHGGNDEEIRKRLMSFFRSGSSAMVWDNVVGAFDSAAFAGALTSESFTDRILGVSEVATVPNRAMFLFTGNNLTLAGDMGRRILVARIDPRTDKPYARSFDVDPEEHVRRNRVKMVVAALTLMRGWLSSGNLPAEGRMASFEAWNDRVRNTVDWVGRFVVPGEFADPMEAVHRAMDHDPELEALGELLEAFSEVFGFGEVTTQQIMGKVGQFSDPQKRRYVVHAEADDRLYEALVSLNPGAMSTLAALGKTLGYRKDRIVRSRVLRQRKDGHSKSSLWRVNDDE